MKKLLILLSFCGAFTAIQAMEEKFKIGAFTPTPLHSAAHADLLKLLLESGADTAKEEIDLNVAVSNGNAEEVRNLLAEGVTIGARYGSGYTLLHLAARKGYIEIVVMLLEEAKKRNVDIINRSADNGNTPLHDAAHGGHLAVVELLVESGANPNVKNKFGRTALVDAQSAYKFHKEWSKPEDAQKYVAVIAFLRERTTVD